MSLGRVHVPEQAGALKHVLRTQSTPGDISGTAVTGDRDFTAVNCNALIIHSNLCIIHSHNGVVFQ